MGRGPEFGSHACRSAPCRWIGGRNPILDDYLGYRIQYELAERAYAPPGAGRDARFLLVRGSRPALPRPGAREVRSGAGFSLWDLGQVQP